jgi:uncharacterized phage protein gp47/JayE
MPISVINQITERVVKGAKDTSDVLSFSALSIVQVGLQPSTIDFQFIVDYKLTSGAVDWSPVGKEPQPGQAYYVVYTFQPPTTFKSFTQISDEMDVNLRALQPLATTQPGSVTRNLFIDLPANQIASLYSSLQRISNIQSLNNLSDFQGTELDDYGANFGVTRGPATIASGQVTFGASAIATSPILIPQGTRLSTLSTATQASVFFRTIADATIYPGQNTVAASIEAESSGANGNVGSGSIVLISSPILGISVVTNPNPTSGGSDQESDQNYADRIKASFLANDAVTFRGIRSRALAFPNVIDALVVGAGDPLLIRGGGAGGKVDLYIQAEAGIDRVQTDVSPYPGADMVLAHQPVISISSVVNTTTSTTLTPSQYQLIKDFGPLTESTSATDALRVLGGAIGGNILTITYVSNGVLEDVQTFFAVNDENAVPARDFLTRSATQIFIDVGVTIVLLPGTDFGGVEAAITDAVAGYIDNLKLGSEIRYGTVFDLIRNTAGVDDVQPLDTLARRGEGTAATIQLGRNEFPTTGVITVKQAK